MPEINFLTNGKIRVVSYDNKIYNFDNSSENIDKAFELIYNDRYILDEYERECEYCGNKSSEWYDKIDEEYICNNCLRKYY